MHSDELAILRTIIANPDDDLPRLIMADWWDEHGQPERAEFCRVQCEAAGIADRCGHNYTDEEVRRGAGGDPRCGCRWDTLRRRERELLLDNWRDWAPRISDNSTWEVILSPRWTYGGTPACLFRRGFVADITLSGDDLINHADRLFAAAPVGDVRLTEFPDPSVGHARSLRAWKQMPVAGMQWLDLFRAEWPGRRFHPPASPERAVADNLARSIGMAEDRAWTPGP